MVMDGDFFLLKEPGNLQLPPFLIFMLTLR